MVKAHSLLYAIYICLIVSIICGALLYFANLYGQLNLHYNLREEMYLHNQSVVNFALGSQLSPDEIIPKEDSGIEGEYQPKTYGLLTVLLAKTWLRNDTIASAAMVGYFTSDKTALHLANFTNPLSYSGNVRLIGDNKLPSAFIRTAYINNARSELTTKGNITVSDMRLPAINPAFKKVFEGIKTQKTDIKDLEKHKDSLFYNSFFNETKEVSVAPILDNIIFKGNFVLRSNDSIRVKKSAVLEDVILMAPKIIFEEGFKGTVQAFATQGIQLEKEVTLHYPSVVCIYNNSEQEGRIVIKEKCKITGGIVLFGNAISEINKNSIEIEEGSSILGDIYCSGKLNIKCRVYGTVYTNNIFHKTASGMYDNMIMDAEINPGKRPSYFISIPLFDTKTAQYGIVKKVL